jgi:hypothetical protein
MIGVSAQAVPVVEGGPRSVRFTLYRRVVLPIDGFVFWIRADQNGPSAMLNTSAFNAASYGSPAIVSTPAGSLDVKGSLHYETVTEQGEEETIAINRMVFTAERPIEDFNLISPTDAYIAELPSGPWGGGIDQPRGLPVKFAFSNRQYFYEQAGIHHYTGTAIYPDMLPQVVDDPMELRNMEVLSNSMAIWMSLRNFPTYAAIGAIPLSPAFLNPDNLRPPFVSISIFDTQAIAAAPTIQRDGTHDQFCSDRVKITLWGFNNQMAMDFVDAVNEYSLSSDALGIMNMPVVKDEKRPQSEIATLAQKKTIEYEISYHQGIARHLARQLILSATVTTIIQH